MSKDVRSIRRSTVEAGTRGGHKGREEGGTGSAMACPFGPAAPACDQRGWRARPEAWAMAMPLVDSARLAIR